MASIIMDEVVRAPATTVWDALSNVGAGHRVFARVLSDCRLVAENTRIATFMNGLVVTERIISIDAERKRLAYTVVSGGFEHHSASMLVLTHDEGTCRFVWTTDVLPDSAIDRVRPLMDAGTAALRRTFEPG